MAIVLIPLVLACDISWAILSHNATTVSDNKLAVSSIFKGDPSDFRDNLYALYIYRKIEGIREKHGIPADRLRLESVKFILDTLRESDPVWFDNHISYSDVPDDEEVHINFLGHQLRYYYNRGPESVDRYRSQVISEAPLPDIGGLHVQYLRIRALPAIHPADKVSAVSEILADRFGVKGLGVARAREVLTSLGEDADRWEDALGRLIRAEIETNRGEKEACARLATVDSPAGETQEEIDWFQAERDIHKFMRAILADPATCDITYIEHVLNNLPYATGRRAMFYSMARAGQSIPGLKRTTLLPAPSFTDHAMRDWSLAPGSVNNYFEVLDSDEPFDKSNMLDIQKEAATISYSIEGDTLVVNEFQVSQPYRNKGVGAWLFARVLEPLYEAQEISRVRFDYRALGAREFLIGISRPSRQRLVVGPFFDDYGEYFMPGEYFTGLQPDERIKPEILVRINMDLIMATDPDKGLMESMGELSDAVDRISEAAGCPRLVTYIPQLDDSGSPVKVAVDGLDRYRWQHHYRRGTRTSRVENEPFYGGKRLIEMMGMGVISQINIDGVCEYEDGIWFISDRARLIDELGSIKSAYPGLNFDEIIEDMKHSLKLDLEQYGEDGKSICYGYGKDVNGEPLFSFVAFGALSLTQRSVIRSGLAQARIAAGRIRLLHMLAQKEAELVEMDKEAVALQVINDRLAGFFHAMAGSMMMPFAYLRRTPKTDDATRAITAANAIDSANREVGAIIRSIRELAENMGALMEDVAEDQTEGLKLLPVDRRSRSFLSVFHLMLASDSIDAMRARITPYLHSQVDGLASDEDIGKAAAIALKYRNRVDRLSKMIESCEVNYRAILANREDIRARIIQIPQELEEVRRTLIEWKLAHEDTFKMVNALPASIVKGVKSLFIWLNSSLSPEEVVVISDFVSSIGGDPEKIDGNAIVEALESSDSDTAKELRSAMPEWRRLPEMLKTAAPVFRGRPLSREETREIFAAVYIDRFFPILDELISFAPGALRLEVELDDIDLIRLVEESMALANEQIDNQDDLKEELKSIRPVMERDPASCSVSTDPDIAKPFIIADLIKNAVKYNRPGGSVSVAVAKDADNRFARVSVTDTGVGISEEDRKKNLFVRERRLESTKDEVPGTGIGLYLAKRSAKWVGAHLVLEDSVVGGGSVFTIYLPLSGNNSVWPVSDEEVNVINEKIKLLEHISRNLRIQLSIEMKRLRPYTYQDPDCVEIMDSLKKIWRDADRAAAIAERLREDFTNEDVSAAYINDTLERRLRPLLDAGKLTGIKDDLRRYYMSKGLWHSEAFGSNPESIIFEPGNSALDYPVLLSRLFDGNNSDGPLPVEEQYIAPSAGYEHARTILSDLDGLFEKTDLYSGRRVVFSETLFDSDELIFVRTALKPLFEKGRVDICPPEEALLRASNVLSSRDNLAVIMSDEDYHDESLWRARERAVFNSSVLIMKGDLSGNNYLYMQGLIALANAVMVNDKVRIKAIYSMLSDRDLGDDVLGLLDNVEENRMAFAVKAMIEMRPFDLKNARELEDLKLMMENFLIMA